ncbi:polyprenyl synthetase family protein [Thalassiella azotivora]
MTTTTSRPATLPGDELTALLPHVLDDLLRSRTTEWSGAPRAEELLDDLRASVGGGKLLRPRFCYLGHQGAGRGASAVAVAPVSAALELLHAFALVHDDVMDGSATRRGAPAQHVRQATRHARLGWRGERRRYAEGTAVLVGDLAFALAQRVAGDLPADGRRVWHDMCGELVLGQYLDVRGTAAGETGAEYACTVAMLKSARYTVVRPLQLGASVAGALPELEGVYTAYGEPLGLAFQLQDDLLGTFGDPAVTGKPAGDDLREGKPTLLLALARQGCADRERALLERAGADDVTDAEVAAITRVCETSGARAEVGLRIDRCVQQAHDALADPVLSPTARDALHAMVDVAVRRDR